VSVRVEHRVDVVVGGRRDRLVERGEIGGHRVKAPGALAVDDRAGQRRHHRRLRSDRLGPSRVGQVSLPAGLDPVGHRQLPRIGEVGAHDRERLVQHPLIAVERSEQPLDVDALGLGHRDELRLAVDVQQAVDVAEVLQRRHGSPVDAVRDVVDRAEARDRDDAEHDHQRDHGQEAAEQLRSNAGLHGASPVF
jgi:hypothetical protein